ncbi:GNAT family N-acetyltransferase [Streptomyces sp. NPDC050145]|uniref:GNAT family N-acetyltransferase n=1 Tax=Streptomyces sp. NPDC050145 TaxID=3365602 RepID=UPI0037BE103E
MTRPKVDHTLKGRERGAYAEPAPGVFAYDGDVPVGWAAVAPRAQTSYARSRVIPHVDKLPVWSLWCLRVRPGHRKKGVSHALIEGAVAYARERGAPAIEAYPLDNGETRVDTTMAYVGMRRNFERAGFTFAAGTKSKLVGLPRIVMRLDLR